MTDSPTVTVFSDIVCELGEGPSAHPLAGRLFWFDILNKRLFERPFDRTGTIIHDLPFHGTVAAAIDGGRQLIAAETGFYVREIATNTVTLHTPHLADDTATRTNDGRVHPAGALWVGTMGWDPAPERGAIWWFRKGEVRKLFDGIAIPNAISFAPDGTHAYFSDTKVGTLYRVETDPATGLPTGEPKVFVSVTDGGPDGAVVDADGLLWNARWGGGALDVYAPDGRRIRSIAIPAKQASCPCFFGPNADRLVVTSAHEGMDAAARAADPLAGQTFLVDLPVRGRFDPPVEL
ncbi:SMP-30/gluconolactonase/LRE family protein [Chthonobacter rhizosphaerae]|uniref:SMP-30/gluconolactonase/LRE family protein n=1 Tax=Chthonobacter rhizosphaerae TaxID=2735553 RepID=UPI0015EF54A9|nr:SMP-30/gluconolactonase/LRE family protein [Chthonobacter rhizosphaerae]